jgi:NADPH:quinone reductase-like Zn-dependent oxidoreductase
MTPERHAAARTASPKTAPPKAAQTKTAQPKTAQPKTAQPKSGESVKLGERKPTGTTSTMNAIVHYEYGPAEVLHLARIARPTVTGNQVLVRVHAAGLDRGVWHMTMGLPYLIRLVSGIRTPKNPVPGLDLAGTIVEVGAAVTKFAVGDEVFGWGKGSFAEFAVAAEDKLARKPLALSFEQAAVVPVSASTALQAMTDVGRLHPGQTVLVIGASGGVGSYAVQLANAVGAEVTAVCSSAKVDLVRSLGADHVIDYSRDDFADGSRRFDLILDIGGNPSLSRLRRALTPTGTAVIVGGERGGRLTGIDRQLRARAMTPFIRQRLTNFIAKQRSSDLDKLSVLLEAGIVTPAVDRTFPLDQVPDAMRYLQAGKARGKIAITV